MSAEVVKVSADNPQRESLQRAGEIIRRGGLVAFPTETVYGLGGNALDPEASRRIYAAKGRPSDNPLIVHIADIKSLEAITVELPEEARKLAKACWPGPLTMILKKTPQVPPETTGGLDSVAVRFPSHPVALMLIEEAGGFVAAPSANASGRPSPTTAAHVWEDLGQSIDMILDAGPVQIGLESTIVDLTSDPPTILRPGYYSLGMLRSILPDVRMDPGLPESDPLLHPKAPGMKYRHYAPRAELTIIEGDRSAVVQTIRSRSEQMAARGKKVGILSSQETADQYPAGLVLCVGSLAREETIARQLYDCLRALTPGGWM